MINHMSQTRPPRPKAPPVKREYTNQHHLAAIRIQAVYRSWRVRRRHASEVKRARLRARVSNEILATEQTYVRSLDTIVDWYLTPIEKNKLIDKKDIDAIFLNIADIREFNHDLLDSLQQRVVQWSRDAALGDVFANKVKFDKYNFYCSNYDTAADRLAKVMKTKKIEQFIQNQRTVSGSQLDLPSLLIMPVQRIPRYKLLLEELLKHTPETHPDYKSLHVTLGQLKFIADLVNERIRDRQNRDAILAVEKRVSGCPKLEKEGRVFLKEGKLMKICRKEPKPRLFFLFNDILIYASDDALSVKFHLMLQLETTAAEDAPDRPGLINSFEILSKNKSFQVYAGNPDEKREWLTALQEAIRKRQKLISRDHSFGSTIAPVWVPDQQAKNCMLCQKEFTLTQRRHHCRRCGRCVCNDCSTRRHKLNQDEKPARVCDRCFHELQGPVQIQTAAAPAEAQPPSPVSDEDTVAKNLRRLTVVTNRPQNETTDRKPPGPLVASVMAATQARKPAVPSSYSESSSSSSSPQSSTSSLAPLDSPTSQPSASPSSVAATVSPRPSGPVASASSGSLGVARAPPRPAVPLPRPPPSALSQRASAPGAASAPEPSMVVDPVVSETSTTEQSAPAASIPAFVPPKRALPRPNKPPAGTDDARARAATANAAIVHPSTAVRSAPSPAAAPKPAPPGAVAVLPFSPLGAPPRVPNRPPSATTSAVPPRASAPGAYSAAPPAPSYGHSPQPPLTSYGYSQQPLPQPEPPYAQPSEPSYGYPHPHSTQPPAPSCGYPQPQPQPSYSPSVPPAPSYGYSPVYAAPPYVPPVAQPYPYEAPVAEGSATEPPAASVAKGVAVLPVLAVPPAAVLHNTGGGKKLWAKPPPRPKEPPPP